MRVVDYLILALVAGILFFAVRRSIRRKASGACSGCGGGCAGCTARTDCAKQTTEK